MWYAHWSSIVSQAQIFLYPLASWHIPRRLQYTTDVTVPLHPCRRVSVWGEGMQIFSMSFWLRKSVLLFSLCQICCCSLHSCTCTPASSLLCIYIPALRLWFYSYWRSAQVFDGDAGSSLFSKTVGYADCPLPVLATVEVSQLYFESVLRMLIIIALKQTPEFSCTCTDSALICVLSSVVWPLLSIVLFSVMDLPTALSHLLSTITCDQMFSCCCDLVSPLPLSCITHHYNAYNYNCIVNGCQ